MNKSKITVLIADDHPIFRQGLRQIIASGGEFEIVAEVGDGNEALEKIRSLKPQVAVLDVDMPGRTGLEVLKNLNENNLSSAIILLTMYKEESFFNAALNAGAKGYVIKDSASSEITLAIRAVAKGEDFISPMLSTLLLKRLKRAEKPKNSQLESLTSSEYRVLKLVSEGKNSQEIANQLFISIRTVETHRMNICRKLDLEGKNALLLFAMRNKEDI